MDTDKYIEFLRSEVEFRQENLKVLGEMIETTAPPLDPNWRLEQGKLFAIVDILKDLCEMTGHQLPDDFYPDNYGLVREHAI